MRPFAKFIFIMSLFSACAGNKDSLEPFVLKSPVAMNLYCQSEPDSAIQRVEFEYKNDLIEKETTIIDGSIDREITFQYNENDLIIKETSQRRNRVTEKEYIYNDLGQLEKLITKRGEIDNNGQFIVDKEHEETYEYENNLLIKELASWGGFTTYEYEEDKLVQKIEHTKAGLAHHFTEYKYKSDLLSEEIKTNIPGNTLYHKVYHYDAKNRLDFIEDRNNVIEENAYKGKKLLEKRVYYFGIDPYFYPCAGNLIYQYEY